MKIVHCVFSFGIGGAETMLIDILNEQSKTETVSLVIVNHVYLDFLLEQINPAVRIFKLRRQKGSYSPFPVLKLNWLLYRLNPDVIHVHSSALLRIIALRAGRGLFLTGRCVVMHDAPSFLFITDINRFIFFKLR